MIVLNGHNITGGFPNLKLMGRIVAALLFLLVASTTYSQKVSAIISRDKIRLGDHFDVKLLVDPVSNSPLSIDSWFNIPDTFASFQVVTRQTIDTVSIASTKGYHQIITLTSFDTGMHIVPAFTVVIGKKQYQTQPFNVSISPIDVSLRKDYNDIKDIIEPAPETDYTLWEIMAGVIVWVAILYFVIKKWIIGKKRKYIPIHPKDFSLNNYLAQLNALETIYQSEKYQQFYTDLLLLCKDFSDHQLHITTKTKTNSEYITVLKKAIHDKELLKQYVHLLHQAERVKFAKATPTTTECKQSLEEAKAIITQLASSRPKTAADVI